MWWLLQKQSGAFHRLWRMCWHCCYREKGLVLQISPGHFVTYPSCVCRASCVSWVIVLMIKWAICNCWSAVHRGRITAACLLIKSHNATRAFSWLIDRSFFCEKKWRRNKIRYLIKLLYKPSPTNHIFLRRIWDVLEILEIIHKKETIYNPFFTYLSIPRCTAPQSVVDGTADTRHQSLELIPFTLFLCCFVLVE